MKPRLLYLLLIISPPLFAQQSRAELEQRALDSAIHLYQDSRGDALEIYSGSEYAGQPPGEGTPFVDDKGWNKGDLVYNGRTYRDVSIRYEALDEVLVITPPTGFRTIALYSPRISRFSSNGRNYIYLDSLQYTNLPHNGFYAVLVDGPTMQLLERRQKYIRETAEQTGIRREFLERTAFFVPQGNTVKQIRSDKDLFQLMGTKADAVKSSLRKQKLKYRREPEFFVTQAVTLYNQLP